MIVLLSGGVGGAKMAEGLVAICGNRLAVIGNTADDLDWCGLRVCPDLDILMYTLADLVNRETGWGLAGDTFHALGMLDRYGQSAWFHMGDRDLATAVLRTHWLREGVTLTEVTARLCRALGVQARLIPMSDAPVRTKIQTPTGELAFQEYFVARGARDPVLGVRFDGAEAAVPSPEIRALLSQAEVMVFAPSNPLVSIGPILAVPGIRETLRRSPAVKVGVSPLVAGRAVKGPLADMMQSLGYQVTAAGVAALYRDLLDVFVLDHRDADLAAEVERLGMAVEVRETVMTDHASKRTLAAEVLEIGSRRVRR